VTGLRIAVVTWIERTYHRRRRQTALGRPTPIEYEMIKTPQGNLGRLTQPVTRSRGSPAARSAAWRQSWPSPAWQKTTTHILWLHASEETIPSGRSPVRPESRSRRPTGYERRPASSSASASRYAIGPGPTSDLRRRPVDRGGDAPVAAVARYPDAWRTRDTATGGSKAASRACSAAKGPWPAHHLRCAAASDPSSEGTDSPV
jgi:hypothetical protein